MAINRTTANFKLREDLVDQITPKALQNMEIDRSMGNFLPAAWLPVQFTKSSYQSGEDAFVISAFKPVSLDTQGRVVPSGLRTSLGGNSKASAHTATSLVYTATDVSWGVIDLVTGLPVTAAVSYTGLQLCNGLIERGLVRDDEAITAGATVPASTSGDVNIIIDLFISQPVGIVLQDVNVWSGTPEDPNSRGYGNSPQAFTNYSKQHGVTFLTHATLRVPHRVAGSTTSDAFDAATLDGSGSTSYTAGAFIDDGEYWNITNIRQVNRYSYLTSTAPVVALGLAERVCAKNTTRTPLSCDRDGVLVRERTHPDLIAKEGDYYFDYDVGVLFLHSDTWETLVALGSANTTFSYSFYTDTGVAGAHRYIHFDGPCRPGDFITYDEMSNFTVASSTVVSAGLSLGRVHAIISEPKDLLESVKTGWNLANASNTMKMPGTATQGYSDLITLSQEEVSDQLVQIIFNCA